MTGIGSGPYDLGVSGMTTGAMPTFGPQPLDYSWLGGPSYSTGATTPAPMSWWKKALSGVGNLLLTAMAPETAIMGEYQKKFGVPQGQAQGQKKSSGLDWARILAIVNGANPEAGAAQDKTPSPAPAPVPGRMVAQMPMPMPAGPGYGFPYGVTPGSEIQPSDFYRRPSNYELMQAMYEQPY